MSWLEVGVSCQHGASDSKACTRWRWSASGSSANSTPATRSPGGVSRVRVVRRSVGWGEAFDRPVALERVHEAGEVAGGDAQLAAQVK